MKIADLLSLPQKQRDRELIKAAKTDDYEYAQVLITLGANVQCYDSMAFACAVENEHSEVVDVFINNGVQPNLSVLVAACANNNLTLMTRFLSMGVDIKDIKGSQLLSQALVGGAKKSMIKFLLVNGATFIEHPELILAGLPNVRPSVAIMVKSWMMYRSSSSEEFAELLSPPKFPHETTKVGERISSNVDLFDILLSSKHPDEIYQDGWERLISIFVAVPHIDLSGQAGYSKYKPMMEKYVEGIKKYLGIHLNRDIVQLIIFYL